MSKVIPEQLRQHAAYEAFLKTPLGDAFELYQLAARAKWTLDGAIPGNDLDAYRAALPRVMKANDREREAYERLLPMLMKAAGIEP